MDCQEHQDQEQERTSVWWPGNETNISNWKLMLKTYVFQYSYDVKWGNDWYEWQKVNGHSAYDKTDSEPQLHTHLQTELTKKGVEKNSKTTEARWLWLPTNRKQSLKNRLNHTTTNELNYLLWIVSCDFGSQLGLTEERVFSLKIAQPTVKNNRKLCIKGACTHA